MNGRSEFERDKPVYVNLYDLQDSFRIGDGRAKNAQRFGRNAALLCPVDRLGVSHGSFQPAPDRRQ